MAEPADDILQGNDFERSGDGVVESSLGTGLVLTHERFEFRESLLYRIEVRAVRRQEQQLTTSGRDGLSHGLVLMHLLSSTSICPGRNVGSSTSCT